MSSRCEILLVRHGQTEWNLAGKWQGQLDSPLTELGRRQAKAVARRLAKAPFDVLYASDLGRTQATAGAIAKLTGHAIVPDKRLRERLFGVLQGRSFGELQSMPEVARRLHSGDVDYAPPGGESVRDIYQRTAAALDDIAARHENQRVVVVTHGGVVGCAFKYVVGLPLDGHRRYSLLNASINTVARVEGLWHLECWGDVQHLHDLDSQDTDPEEA